jgi:hypothetical protein
VSAHLHDLSLLHHDYLISIHNCGKAMGNHYGGDLSTQLSPDFLNRILHLLLILFVQSTGRLV